MAEKKNQPARKLLDCWMTFCIRKNKRCFSRQMEDEISSLNPGLDVRKLVYEHYRQKISLGLCILAAGCALILFYLLSSQTEQIIYEEQYLKRSISSKEEKTVELDAQVGDIKLTDITIEVEGRHLDKKEGESLLKMIADQLPAVVLGENKALTYVDKPLYLPVSWENMPVSIIWESSNLDYLKEDGSFGTLTAPESGKRILLTAILSYEDISLETQITVTLFPPQMSEEERMKKKLEGLIEQEKGSSLTEEYLKLPKQLDNTEIIWKEPKGEYLPVLILLVISTVPVVFAGKDQDLHREYEQRNKQLLLEYPEFVSKLQLWISSGMSIHSALFKMGREYQRNLQKGGKKKYVGEELLLALRKMENGMGEADALRFFGKRCHMFCYKKLVSLILQNLNRGADGLREALMNETKMAFEERKQAARKLGEEAGTKLLFPMMLMMGVVLIIIMVPAYFSFGNIGS